MNNDKSKSRINDCDDGDGPGSRDTMELHVLTNFVLK